MNGRDGRRVWVIAIFLFVLGDGLTLQTRGPLLRSLEADFGVSEALLGLVSPAGTAGFVVAVLIAGLLAGRIDIKRWMLAGIGLTALSLLLMSGAPVYWVFLLLLVGQGTATGVVRGLDRTVLSHLYPGGRARMFTLHAVAWAIGAVCGPLFINAVLARGDWRIAYALLGVLFLPLIVLVWRVGLPEDVAAERALSLPALGELLRRPIVIGMACAVTLSGITEGIIFAWLPFFASEFMPIERANVLLTIFLLAYIPGRLLYTYALSYVNSLTLAVVLSGAFIPPIWVSITGPTGIGMFVAVFVAGFFAAGFFPLISAFGVEAVPEYAGPITALATGGAYVGLSSGPVLVGFVAEWTDITVAIRVAVLTAVACFLTLAVTWGYGIRRPNR